GYLDPQVLVSFEREQMIDDGEVARGLPVTMLSHPLVDGREVVQHLVRLIDIFFEKPKDKRQAILRYPKRRYLVSCFLSYRSRAKPVIDLFCDCGNSDHISSVSLNRVVFFRKGCIRSRIEGRGARVVCWGPTTQLSGRRSVPTACRNNSSP